MAIDSFEFEDPIEDGYWGNYGQWFFGDTNPLAIGSEEADAVARAEIDRRGGNWCLLDEEGSPERSDEVMTVVEAVKAGFYSVELAEVVEELDAQFEEARVQWCKKAAIREYRGNRKFCSAKVLAAAVDVDPDDNWEPMPDKGYFKREVLPTLVGMMRDGEDLREMFDVMMECIPRLLQHQFQATSNRTSPELIKEFFKPFMGRHLDCYSMGVPVDGQFEYFYKKYGKYGAMLAASYQGFFCDPHYGGGSYTKGIKRVEFALKELFEKLPEAYQEKSLEILASFKSYWHHSSAGTGSDLCADKFFNYFPEIIKGLIENPPIEDAVGVYMKMIEASPGDFAHTPRLHDLHSVIKELKAWDALGDNKDLGLDIYAMAEGIRYIGSGREYQFAEDRYYSRSVGGLLGKLHVACLGEQEEVRRVFALLEASDLKNRTKLHVLQSYATLMGIFDSFEECVVYLGAFADMKSLNSLVLMLGSERSPFLKELANLKLRDGMLAKLTEFMGVMGHSACEVMGYDGDFVRCYFEEPEKIDRMMELGRELPDLKGYGGLRACLFDLAWKKHGPGQEAALEAFMKKAKDPSMLELFDENEDLYTRILVGMIMEIKRICVEEWEDGRTKYYPADFDYYRELCVLEHCLEKLNSFESYYLYTRQVLAGTDPNLMVYLLGGNEGFERYCNELYPEDIPGVPLPIDRKDGDNFVRVFRDLMQIEKGISALSPRDTLSKDRVCAVATSALEEWRVLRAEVLERSKDEKFSALLCFDSALKSLDEMFGILFIKDVMGIGFKSDRFKMRDEGLFAGTNELTKSAIAGSAFLAATGAMKIDGLDLPKTAMMGQ
ncbi:hypothetical protein JKY72_04140, partial [Candidatus Gracilibacteria bacterium]|nr:hypothetical protein [Candidatus Gracilibacteria bacterium]